MKAVKTLEDLRERCVLDDVSGCWVWKGGLSSHKSGTKSPVVRFGGTTGIRAMRLAKLMEAGFEDRGEGFVVYRNVAKCSDPLCINPEHSLLGDWKARGAHQRKTGALCGIPSKIAAARNNARKTAKLTMDQAREIRVSPKPNDHLALVYGVDVSVIQGIKRGTKWPEQAPNASVFNWRPAA